MEFKNWVAYFEQNAHAFEEVNWTEGCLLTKSERNALSYSIRQFQRGEESEGTNLQRMSTHMEDPQYAAAIRLFIREEQQHAAGLGRFLDINNLGRLDGHWTDNAFRKLRKSGGLELAIRLLLVAELVASVYYKALMRASGSITLKQICAKILRDEEMHLHFQCAALKHLSAKKSVKNRLMYAVLYRPFYLMVCCLVTIQHRKVLRAGGMGMLSCMGSLIRQFDRAEHMIQGRIRIIIKQPHGIRLRSYA